MRTISAKASASAGTIQSQGDSATELKAADTPKHVQTASGTSKARAFPEGQQITQRGLEIYQSGGVRALYWAHAANLIAQAPWAGWGYGAFEFSFLNEYAAKMALQPQLLRADAASCVSF